MTRKFKKLMSMLMVAAMVVTMMPQSLLTVLAGQIDEDIDVGMDVKMAETVEMSIEETDDVVVDAIEQKDHTNDTIAEQDISVEDSSSPSETTLEPKQFKSADDIASGTYENITWAIDADGKLTVEGTGEFSVLLSERRAPWWSQSEKIKTAVVRVTDLQNASYMFYECVNLTSLDVSGFDTSSVTDMSSMFKDCYSLTSLDVSGFDTSSVTDMSSMFNGCRDLTSLDVNGFDTSSVTDMSSMFSVCRDLTSLDVSGFDTSSVTDMSFMFCNCYSLTSLNVSGFDTRNVTDMSFMFSACSLTSLDVSGFDTGNVTNMGEMFYDCDSITQIMTFPNLQVQNVKLPVRMHDNSGNVYDFCPVGLEDSIVLYVEETPHNITWSIDADGKLTVEGTGEFSVLLSYRRAPWYSQSEKIKTAVVRVTGLQNASYMFNGCYNLTSVDMSGFDTSSVTDMSSMFMGCWDLARVDVSGFDTSSVTDMSSMFFGCNSLTSVDMSGFDTSSVTDMGWMFWGCEGLTSVDMSGFDTSNVTDMGFMFEDCYSLTSLDVSGFDTSSVTDMSSMFFGCNSLTSMDMRGFDTSSVTDMSSMFSGCGSLTTLDVRGFDTSNVTDMSFMFSGCGSLTTLDVRGFDTSNVTDMSSMFWECNSLTSMDVSSFDTSRVTDMSYMFYGCDSITQLKTFPNLQVQNVKLPVRMHDNSGNVYDFCPIGLEEGIVLYVEEAPQNIIWSIDADGKLTVEGIGEFSVLLSERRVPWYSQRDKIKTAVVRVTGLQNASYMFNGCYNLTSVDMSGFDTSSVTDMSSMFKDCYSLTSVDMSGFDTSNVTDMSSMFRGCWDLASLDVSGFNTSRVTDMSSMFLGCWDLTSLDLSGFDMSNVFGAEDMINNSGALVTLYTPYGVKTGMSIYISSRNNRNYKWHDSSGNTYITLPEGLDYSILLTNGAKPDAVQEELIVNLLKKTYGQGSEIAPKDLRVKYRGTDGKTVILSLKGTDGADNGYTLSAVDMNTPGEKKVTVSYNDGTKTLTKDVSFTVVEKVVETTEPSEEESSTESENPSESSSASEPSSESSAESESASESSNESESSSESSGESEPSTEPADSAGLHVTFPEGKIFTYTGSAIKPAIEVTNNGETLTEGTDYTVKYSNNTKAGTAKITVTGKGSFTGKQDTTFTIAPRSLLDDGIVANDITIAANSKAVPVVLYNGMKLSAKDYTLSNTGKITEDEVLTITGKGNYQDEITVNVKVVESLGKFKVNMNKDKLVYNGEEQRLGFEVIDSKTKEPLKEDAYMAVYSEDVTNAGTVKVTVIGLGSYGGSITKSYKINPLKTDMELSFDKQKEYTFNSLGTTVDDISVKVKESGAELEYGRDYKISYSANKKAGTGKINATFLGNYKGSKALKDTFTIKPEVLDSSTVNVIVPDKAYTGKKNAYKSAPIVTDKSGNALKSSDYTATYYADYEMTKEIKGRENLIELEEGSNSATVYVKITGKGNYAGDTNAYAKGEYNVVRTTDSVLDLSKAKVTFKNEGSTVKKLEYTGNALEPDVEVTVKVKGAGTIILDSSQYDIRWTNNVNKGKATAVITGNGTEVKGYAFVGSKNATINITAGNLKNMRNLFDENVSKFINNLF